MKRCLDEGTLQAYLDGELSHEAARETAEHIASCDLCAEMLSVAGDETAIFASAFAPDANLSVPTAELRARVNAAVARLESQASQHAPEPTGWSFASLVATLSGLLTVTQRRAAAFAGVAAVVVLVIVTLVNQPHKEVGTDIASNPPSKNANSNQVTVASDPVASPSPTPEEPSPAPTNEKKETATPKSKSVTPKRRATPFTPVPAKKLDEKFLPGEKEYQAVIANLEKTIKAGDAVLKPKVISNYERNRAVLDRAIEESRRVALMNPKDKDAMSFLMSAYQSKVELMTTVADNAQVATLDR